MGSVAPHWMSAAAASQMPVVLTLHWEDSKDSVGSHWMSAGLAFQMPAVPVRELELELLRPAAVRSARSHWVQGPSVMEDVAESPFPHPGQSCPVR